MLNSFYLSMIPLLPLSGFIVLGLFGRKYFRDFSGVFATCLVFITTVLSVFTAWKYFFESGKADGVYQKIMELKIPWLEFSPDISIDMGILLDPISVMMIVVVSFVSFMVHLYSISYLKGEERYATYFSFLQLFTFSMLGLVLSSNIFQMYIFWELVGVSSYLLIGFHYDRPSAVAASKKAFIVTRFADLGFLIGIFILSFNAQTLDFNVLIERLTDPSSEYLQSIAAASFLGISALTWGLVLVFVGGAGKSAMFPLHIWLPDAMEGPTPVSALIHAATMVVAGVFLVARLFPVYALACPVGLDVVAFVGILSAFFAAVIACTQTDIKRVLAYSTMSQIGYMMFALGVSNYFGEGGLGFAASQFHLFTHAMFKALLFLAAGVVIHYVHTNDMFAMGGLRKFLPVTHITFLIACFAISGIPPLSGFFSKEEILLAAWNDNKIIYGIALLTSGITAFYMFRLYFVLFWNKEPRSHNESHGEGSFLMLIPLILLAAGAVLSGFIPFSRFVTSDGIPGETKFHLEFSIAPVLFALAGILIAMKLYKKQNDIPLKISATASGLYAAAYSKFYIDEIYLFVTRKIIFYGIGRPAAWIDKNIVDGAVNFTGMATQAFSESIKGMQSGKVQQYAAVFFTAAVVFALVFIYLWK
jgi:NADH-quinone oxidoreductase subunit L